MTLVLRIVLAVVVGLLVTGLLDYFGILTHSLNALLGFVAAVVTFLTWDGALPNRRV